MTIPEIARELGRSNKRTGDTVHAMAKPSATLPKRLYVCAWRSETEGVKGAYMRPVFALGDRPDAPKPAVIHNRRRINNDYRKRLKASFVFNLGVGIIKARATNRRTAANQETQEGERHVA